jgi:hypothetical protein
LLNPFQQSHYDTALLYEKLMIRTIKKRFFYGFLRFLMLIKGFSCDDYQGLIITTFYLAIDMHAHAYSENNKQILEWKRQAFRDLSGSFMRNTRIGSFMQPVVVTKD